MGNTSSYDIKDRSQDLGGPDISSDSESEDERPATPGNTLVTYQHSGCKLQVTPGRLSILPRNGLYRML